MLSKDEEFLVRLQSMFKIEALEHVNVLIGGLLELEKKPAESRKLQLVETIFREAHSLKGAARSVNRVDIESICQVLESIFAKLRDEKLTFSATQYDLIHKSIDVISELVSGNEGNLNTDLNDLKKQLQYKILSGEPNKVKEIEPPPGSAGKSFLHLEQGEEKILNLDTIRIQTSRLDMLFLQAEHMIQSKIVSAHRSVDLKNILLSLQSLHSELDKWYSVNGSKIDPYQYQLVKDLNENFESTILSISSLSHSVESDQRSLGKMIDEHIDSLKKVLMLPISSLFEFFPKYVRDLARSQGKEVELLIQGAEIEVDKRILEELKDPLIHIIRNCIDHGIKMPDTRIKSNKSGHGIISINSVVKDGHNIEISISDDGTGIEMEKVISAAIKAGTIAPDISSQLSRQECLDLIFTSGTSTSPLITDLSGRGLGLAIVKEKVERLGGKVTVESLNMEGTTFRIILPLTISTFRGILIQSASNLFFVPTANVERVLKVSEEDIKTVENQDTISFGKEIIRILKLSYILGLTDRNPSNGKNDVFLNESNKILILIMIHGGRKIGFIIDEIEDEQQIIVKELGKQLKRVRYITGATILGSGKIVPILNVSDLMKASKRISHAPLLVPQIRLENIKNQNILVTDDSITARSLIKNILESAGFIVTTAVDGVDAFTKAVLGGFDLIVSDVDMPRMNGFELTAKIRKDKRTSEVPVVLVTALESNADKEHGIDVGANAYIVKSSFDQSNLLEVIQKLI